MKTNNFAECLLEMNRQILENRKRVEEGLSIKIKIEHLCGDSTIINISREKAQTYTQPYARSK
jgi:hypothetical protein